MAVEWDKVNRQVFVFQINFIDQLIACWDITYDITNVTNVKYHEHNKATCGHYRKCLLCTNVCFVHLTVYILPLIAMHPQSFICD